MDPNKSNSPVRLRRGMDVLLAVQWNLPILLMFSHSWSVFQLTMVANCYLWALGCALAGAVPWVRSLFFNTSEEGVPPRWKAAAVMMTALGTGTLIAWFLDPRNAR